jgi:osmoprotectant transport system substrate-binding protein
MTKLLAARLRMAGLAAVSILVGVAAAMAQTRDPVVVASKIDTEGNLLGHMIALVLERQNIPVENRVGLGPTMVVRSALIAGEIDIYPEYTGNGALFHGTENEAAWKQARSAFELVKRLDGEKHQLVWLDRAPANNTWLIAVRGDVARREGLATMEDFARGAVRAGALKLVASAEFVESPAALPAFERVYGFRFPREALVVLPGGDTAVTIRSAAQGVSGVNAAMVYGTDGAIAALDLVVMQDTKGAQIVYEPAPVVRAAVLQRYPAIAPALTRVFATLSMPKLQSLNAQIAVEGRPAREVARQHLEQEGLLR